MSPGQPGFVPTTGFLSDEDRFTLEDARLAYTQHLAPSTAAEPA